LNVIDVEYVTFILIVTLINVGCNL